MALRYPQFSEAADYSAGDKVVFEGLVYQALSQVTGPSTDPDQDPAVWEIVAVNEIINYNTLIEAIRIELNTDDPQINDSIPFFIQMAEESFSTRMRVPIQRRTRVLTTDMEGRIGIPYDLLNVINLRLNVDARGGSYLLGRGRIEILAGNYEEYLELKRYYTNSFYGVIHRVDKYEAPVYWYDGDYFWIAPLPDEGQEVELIYYASIPRLGTTQFRVNDQNQPLNENGQTLVDWIAAGNQPDTFRQQQVVVELSLIHI